MSRLATNRTLRLPLHKASLEKKDPQFTLTVVVCEIIVSWTVNIIFQHCANL